MGCKHMSSTNTTTKALKGGYVGQACLPFMIKVRIKATGEVKEVTRNEAHGLIESDVAVIVHTAEGGEIPHSEDRGYTHRQMRPGAKVRTK